MSAQNSQPGGSKSQEFKVISHCDPKKRVSVIQFPTDQGFDKLGHVTMARENNLREYKSAYNIGAVPTTGAGSEFGREAKEEARRRKFGYIRRNYNSDAQPWLMQIGAEKNGKKFKGSRNGGILENASYFIFTKRKDGTFDATPVEEWYNFKPTVSYNNLNAEEAEEEFARRDKNLNMFNIMVRKRFKKEVDADEDKEKVKKEVKSKGLMLTEMEDWADLSDEDGDPDRGGGDSDDSINGKKVKGKGKGKGKGRKKKSEKDTDDEAMEDSDDGDMEAKQVDYMSDTSDSDSDMEGRADKSKYEEKGVEDEEGLREIVVESDNEKEEKEEPEEEDEKKEKDSAATSSSSESESDDEFTKAFLMTGSVDKKDRGKSPVPRSATPTDDNKRKLQSSPRSGSPYAKKIKQEPTAVQSDVKPVLPMTSDNRPTTPVFSSRDGLTEESVKRYLLRKPMSSIDLCKLFKSKKLGISKEEIVTKISTILRKLNTNQQRINGVIHFSISE